MSLNAWLNEGRLKRHVTSAEEIASLFQVIDRDMADASIEQLSNDRRFATAYNAALQLATIALLATGYRPDSGHGHHWVTISSLTHTMGSQAKARAYYFNACRSKRNRTDYDRAGMISGAETVELLTEVLAFRQEVHHWLREHYPGLLKDD